MDILGFLNPQLGSLKQENPSRSQDFQEPKTKIYETFYLRLLSQPQVLMIRTAAKILLFDFLQGLLLKKRPFWKNFPLPLSFR